MAEDDVKPPKFDPIETYSKPETSTHGEKAQTSTEGEEPPLISMDGEDAPAASTTGEAPTEEKETEEPGAANGDEKEKQIEEKPVDLTAGEGGDTEVTAPESETVKNALEAPLPPEFTSAELIENRKQEKGYLYACCFTLCCCPLCFESYEYILEYLCCQKKK